MFPHTVFLLSVAAERDESCTGHTWCFPRTHGDSEVGGEAVE